MDLNAKISKYFTLGDMLKSENAIRHNVKEQWTPPELVVKKLTALCLNLLDPVQDLIKKEYPTGVISQTSGWRCAKVNELAGGTPGSQHLAGEAADKEMRINGKEENLRFAKAILRSGIIFDQMILEYGTLNRPEWIHLSWDLDKKVQQNTILRIGHNDKNVFETITLSRDYVLKLIEL